MSARDDFMDTYFGRDDEVTQGMVNDYLDRIEAEALKEHGLTIRHGRSSDPETLCRDPRHDEIEAWYRQALTLVGRSSDPEPAPNPEEQNDGL